jgi:hypothetical protein
MTNKIGIGVEAQFDPGAVEQKINALGQKIAQANKVQFKPVSGTTVQDLDKVVKRFEQLLKINGDLRKRVKDTNQGGNGLLGMDWDSLYPDQNSRARQMRKVFEYSVGSHFSGQGAPSPGGGGGRQPPPSGPSVGGAIGGAAQAGLRAAGPAGGVAAGAVGTGMSAGFGAGLMGLMGGMLALGVGKLVGAATENIGKAEDNAVALDRLKRTLGDVNVSFEALKAVVHGGADNLKITYAEAGQLATQFAKLGNVSGSEYKTIADELGVGVGMSRAYGMDPSQGVGVMGQMRGVGLTSNTQDSRRFAMLLGETIGRSGAFAKAEEVFEAIGGYAAAQTRSSLGGANVSGYAGMFSSMVGSGIPGLDPSNTAAILSRLNSSLSAGGAKGEASQFFTSRLGSARGMDVFDTQLWREGGAFGTADSVFSGNGAVAEFYKRYGLKAPTGGDTVYGATMDQMKRDYGSDPKMMLQATANHTGLNMSQAAALHLLKPNQMGAMEKTLQGLGVDLSKVSGSGIGNLSKALFGTSDDRQALAQGLMGRGDVSQLHKEELSAAMSGGSEKQQQEVLARLTAQYEQERTTGSDIRDSKNALDNIKTSIADKMVPLMNSMRLGIMHIAGKGSKSPKEIMEEVMRLEGRDRRDAIKGEYAANLKGAASAPDKIRAEREKVLDELRKGGSAMSAEDRAAKQKRVQELSDQLAQAEEKARKDVIRLKEEEARALRDANAELEKDIKAMRSQGSALPVSHISNQSAAETSRLGRLGTGVAPAAAGATTSTGDPALDAKLAAAEQKNGLPAGTLRSIMKQETGGKTAEYLADPSKYHYGLDANGQRIAGHTGKISTAFGPFGILESTGKKPGYGVSPLKDKSLDEQIRFSAEYLSARSKSAGSLRDGLAGYGEGGAYANGVLSRIPDLTPRPATVPAGGTSEKSASAGAVSGEMSLRLDLSPEARRLLQKPEAPISTRVEPARPFGASGGW